MTQIPLPTDGTDGAPPAAVVDPGTPPPAAPTGAVAADPLAEAFPAPAAPAPAAPAPVVLPPPVVPGAPQVAPPAPAAPAATPAPSGPIVTAPPPPPNSVTYDVPTAAHPEASNVDTAALQTLIGQLRPAFIAAVSDTLRVAQEAVGRAADYYVPLIAQASVMTTSADPSIRSGAERQLRHLRGQALMNAATLGIPLQQRYEQRFISVIETLVSVGVAALTGGAPAALPFVSKLGSAAVKAFKQATGGK